MNRAAANFLTAADGADLALFDLAGHGIQLFDRNFLVARDVDTLSVLRDPRISASICRIS